MFTSTARKTISLLLVMVFLLALITGCSSDSGSASAPAPSTSESTSSSAPAQTPSGDAGGTTYTFRIAAASVAPSAEAKGIEEFKRLVGEATDKVIVETYPGSALGTNVQTIQGLQDGSVQGVCIPASYWEAFCPEIGIVGLPMTFAGPEQMYQVFNQEGQLNQLVDEALAAKGFVVGAWLRDCDSRILSKEPVQSVDDLKGMKIWCLANQNINNTINALGATAVNFDPGDLAVGLQQGTVDAAYTGNTLFRAFKLYDSAKYLHISKVIINLNVLMLSKPSVDALPADLKEIVMDCAAQTGLWHYEYNTTALNAAMDEFLKNGVTVTDADQAFTDYAKKVTAPVIDQYCAQSASCKAIYDAAAAAVKAYTGEVG